MQSSENISRGARNPRSGSRAGVIDMLRSVSEGTRVAHVWRSPLYEGADMAIQYRWPEIEVSPDEHGLPAVFAEEVQLEYAGILTRQEAADKLANMRVAARVAFGL